MDAAILAEITGTDCHIAPFAQALADSKVTRKSSVSTVIVPKTNMDFLVLAPVQSSTYPAAPPTTAATSPAVAVLNPSAPVSSVRAVAAATSQAIATTEKSRRSSSISSTNSGLNPQRFLKLGPVFYGGEPGVGDYAEEVIEE